MDKRLVALGFRGSEEDALREFQRTYRRGQYGPLRLRRTGRFTGRTSRALDHCLANGGRISEHFRYLEFQCHCGGRYSTCRGVRVDRRLVKVLERLRKTYYRSGLTPVSAYRCPQHNESVDGASSSQHLLGRAADIPALIQRDSPLPGAVGGVGFVAATGKITHVDTRKKAGGRVTMWPYY